MFKRSFSRSSHQQVAGTETSKRVDKSARLMKKTMGDGDVVMAGTGGAAAAAGGGGGGGGGATTTGGVGGAIMRAGSLRDQKKQQLRLTKQLQRSFNQQQQQPPPKSSSANERTSHSSKHRDVSKTTATSSSSYKTGGGGSFGGSVKPLAPSSIVTLTVGREGRLFAAHEDVLSASPFFQAACRSQYLDGPKSTKRIALPDEEPEVFSAVLEYLYKGDYYPRLFHNKHRNSWELEDSRPASSSSRRTPHVSPNLENSPTPSSSSSSAAAAAAAASASAPFPSAVEATVYVSSVGAHLLRDTVIYCAAERYGLEELKRLALRKQGLQAGIDVGTILRSAQYCYAHTPDSDSRLRAHYLALIIRCRRTFKRSGTMQAEMERSTAGGEGGGKLFFDLFVALCNHLDDVIEASNKGSPRTI